MRGDEHDRRWPSERRQDSGELEAVEAGHVDVEEHCIDHGLTGGLLELAQGGGRVLRGVHLGHGLLLAQQESQLVQGGPLVVDRQHDQPARRTGVRWMRHARTPGLNLGTRMLTFVPAPGAVSTTRP